MWYISCTGAKVEICMGFLSYRHLEFTYCNCGGIINLKGVINQCCRTLYISTNVFWITMYINKIYSIKIPCKTYLLASILHFLCIYSSFSTIGSPQSLLKLYYSFFNQICQSLWFNTILLLIGRHHLLTISQYVQVHLNQRSTMYSHTT